MSPQAKGKNGKIEFYRFLFCMYVLFFHFDKYFYALPEKWGKPIDVGLFPHGAIGVEFFFVTSGWLMASSIYKKRTLHPETAGRFEPTEGLKFIKRKFVSMLPQRIPAFILAFISYVMLNNFKPFDVMMKAVYSVPAFFLVQMTGYTLTSPNHVEWYISAMLIAMALIYPICVRFYESFTRYFAPLIAILLTGYIMYNTKALSGVTVWVGYGYKAVYRAIIEISLGTTAFELSRYISERKLTNARRTLISLAEIACIAGVTGFVVLTFGLDLEPYALIAIFFLVAIAFSGVSHGSALYNNKLCYFLGKLSLPIYLSQVAAINFTQKYFADESSDEKLIAGITLTVIITAFVMIAGSVIGKAMTKGKNK